MSTSNNARFCLDKLSNMKAALEDNSELFDNDYLYEFNSIATNLEKNISISENKKRVLSIGVIGAVKAGKSSFLNALLFNGEEYLPKAATPMTAALTKISYSEIPKAIIHFYSSDDWSQIEKFSSEYDEKLQESYASYIREYDEIANRTVPGVSIRKPIKSSIAEYEKLQFKPHEASERLQSAKELTEMISDRRILEKLGKVDEIEGDILKKLNTYIGANGQYTPIVNYVEIQINNKSLEGMEIIDTPGLNDPIVSRGLVTKNFLAECDVVLLLSPCSQFMDVNTIRLMTNSFPAAGINEILVIGSKLDTGILNENNGDFLKAWLTSITDYKARYSQNLLHIKNEGYTNSAISLMNEQNVFFVSSLMYSASKKLEYNIPFNAEETNIFNQIRKRFTGFEETVAFIKKLSGLNDVKKALAKVMSRKEEIINTKTSEMASNAWRTAAKVLERIHQDAINNKSKIENCACDDLQNQYASMQNTIDSSRKKFAAYFETAALECEKTARNIGSSITSYISHYTDIKIDTTTTTENEIYHTGLFGWKREVVPKTVTKHSADTSQVILNIQKYIGKCNSIVNQDFDYILDKEKLCSRIKEVIIETFSKGNCDYNEDDILIPLDTVLTRIQIPAFSISANKYIDNINSQFREGVAHDSDIHRLSNAQTTALSEIKDEFIRQIDSCINSISDLLNTQAATFADNISDKISEELERLTRQIAEKQKYICAYNDFIQLIKSYKKELITQ